MIATRVQIRAPLMARSRRNVCKAPAAVIDDVRDVVSDQLGVDLEKVTPDAKFVEDLGADSLDTVEMMMALEDKFGIEISDNVGADSITVVSDVADVIEKIQSGELPNKPPTSEAAETKAE